MKRKVTMSKKVYVLGKEYQDTLHGFRGVATAACSFVNGCDQLCLVRMSGGELKEAWIDTQQLESFVDRAIRPKKKATKKAATRRTGGPQSTPLGSGSRHG